MGSIAVPAVINIDLDIRPNCFTVISGASGSGKTTLLNLIGCIDRPDTGEIRIKDSYVSAMSERKLTNLRLHGMGFIFQNFNLLPVLTAYENVEYPLLLAKMATPERRQRVTSMLDAVGLIDKASHRPDQLSGGQQQRVAIARALVMSPDLVIADEPTANLDSETGADIIRLMRRIQKERKVAFVFSSHDQKVLAAADDAVFIRDGKITSMERREVSEQKGNA
jgi:putative ABC transport system ATP-binding protein